MYELFLLIFIMLAVRIFGGFGSVISVVVIYWSGIGKRLNDRNPGAYGLADQRSLINPLYIKGSFKKRASRIQFVADLQGLYYCQILTAVFIVLALIYKLIYKENILMIRGITWLEIEIFLSVGLVGTMLAGMGIKQYYRWYFDEAYRYTQNKKGTWMPFRYACRPYSTLIYKPFYCNYYLDVDTVKERLYQSCSQNGYGFVRRYDASNMPDLPGIKEAVFFTRQTSEGMDIFELIHVERFTKKHTDILDSIFVVFWESYVKMVRDKGQVCFTYLLCVDEPSEELENKYLDCCSVDQKKGRYRLPAVLVWTGRPGLHIPANRKKSHGGTEYSRMRKELLSLLDLSEGYNNRSYPRN